MEVNSAVGHSRFNPNPTLEAKTGGKWFQGRIVFAGCKRKINFGLDALRFKDI